MMPEAMTRAEHTRAAVAHGGSLRMLSFLGLSAVVHGLLAVALLREAPPRSVSVPPSSAREQALVWLRVRRARLPVPRLFLRVGLRRWRFLLRLGAGLRP